MIIAALTPHELRLSFSVDYSKNLRSAKWNERNIPTAFFEQLWSSESVHAKTTQQFIASATGIKETFL